MKTFVTLVLLAMLVALVSWLTLVRDGETPPDEFDAPLASAPSLSTDSSKPPAESPPRPSEPVADRPTATEPTAKHSSMSHHKSARPDKTNNPAWNQRRSEEIRQAIYTLQEQLGTHSLTISRLNCEKNECDLLLTADESPTELISKLIVELNQGDRGDQVDLRRMGIDEHNGGIHYVEMRVR